MDHYFTAQPASPDERRTLTVEIDGRDLAVDTAAGIFSPGHIDAGTQVLLSVVGTPSSGPLLDLGCGWGPIALTAAARQPEAQVYAVDVNERALDLTRRNAAALAAQRPCAPIHVSTPEAVPADLTFDQLWSNPPIRVGKAALHELLRTWIPRLNPGGEAFLVVAKNLGADSLARWLAEPRDDAGAWGEVTRVASAKGFRVLRLTREG